jgi:enoyl-CoA hydratase/carnithine racemase
MNWNTVDVEYHDEIAIVTLSRPESLNAFNNELVEELTDVARSFHRNHTIKSIVLTGRGKGFCAGFDLKQSPPPDDFAERRDVMHLGRHLCRTWEELPQTTIAAIEGPAVGAGVAITLVCDWRVMAENAYLYVPEVKIGLTLQWQALPRLVALVGPARAKRIIMLCEKMGAAQALDWGLVEEVAPAGEALDKALELARAACAMPPVIMTMTKQAVNATANALLQATSFMDSDVSMLVFDTEEADAARNQFRKSAK